MEASTSVLSQFMPDVRKFVSEETFTNFYAGGEFEYFSVWRDEPSVEYVCLFTDLYLINNPVDPRVIEGVEDGFGLEAIGLYVAGNGELVLFRDLPRDRQLTPERRARTRVEVGDDDCYLFALKPPGQS
jgi:hypothetical protein